MKLLAQTDWDDVDFAMGYTFSFPYCIKWYRLPSGGYLRSSQPYETKRKRTGWFKPAIVTKYLGDPHTVPMTADQTISDMINKGLDQDEVTKLMYAEERLGGA